jgi:hypothetical protein
VTYWLHPDAEAELCEAAVYYAEHASRAVAEAFLAEFERIRNLLVENEARGAPWGLRHARVPFRSLPLLGHLRTLRV